MALNISQEACLGCGSCQTTCPGVFKLGDTGKAEVIEGADMTRNKKCIEEAIINCPVQAISLE